MSSLNDVRFLDSISISPSGFAVYKEYIGVRRNLTLSDDFDTDSNKEKENNINSERTEKNYKDRFRTDGFISTHTAKKIRQKILWLLFLAKDKKQYLSDSKRWVKFKLCFATLTLPSKQRHTDQVIKSKCLNQLLTELRMFHGVKLYLWRAEKQINGNIHFHILTDSFVDYRVLRMRWNRIINKLGYVDEYTRKMNEEIKNFSDYYNMFINQGSYMELIRRYNRGRASGWTDPNTTDIHSLIKIKNIVAYLSKYMAKDIRNKESLDMDTIEKQKVSGMLWGLSEKLSRLNKINLGTCTEIWESINNVWDNVKSYVNMGEWCVYKAIPLQKFIDYLGAWCKDKIIQYIGDNVGFEYANNIRLKYI